jgi:hypothetical protein
VHQTLTSARARGLAALGVLLALGSYVLLNAAKDDRGSRDRPALTLSTDRSSSFRTGAGFSLDAGPAAAAVHWHGRRLDGVVYFTAGPDPLSTDVYRVTGALTNAERLTRSSVNLGISWMTARPGQIVVASGRAGAIDHIESLEHFQQPSSDPGVRGSSPALDTDGTLAYIVNSHKHGLDLIIKPPDGPTRRIAHAPRASRSGDPATACTWPTTDASRAASAANRSSSPASAAHTHESSDCPAGESTASSRSAGAATSPHSTDAAISRSPRGADDHGGSRCRGSR